MEQFGYIRDTGPLHIHTVIVSESETGSQLVEYVKQFSYTEYEILYSRVW